VALRACELAQVEAITVLYVIVVGVSAYLAAGARHEHRERFRLRYQQASLSPVLPADSAEAWGA
jgi:hypothetical protein